MIPLDILFLTGLAVLPSGVLCGLTSIFIYRLRMLTIGFSVAHGALAGAALSMLLQLDPLTLSFLFAFLTALILGPLADILRVPLDLVSMTVFSLHTALALLFIYLTPGTALAAQVVSNILWGSILAVTPTYLVLLVSLLALYILYYYAFKPKILAILFDPRLAEADGINTKPYIYTTTFLVGATIVLMLKLVGGFLVFTLIYTLAITTTQIARHVKKMMLLAPAIGVTTIYLGLITSFYLDLPVGVCIVLTSITILITTLVSKKIISLSTPLQEFSSRS